ncbi:hypothetical protein BDZ45DRAFT_698874 [Acephala macrosclerotiorum]|nr:hypothetical protein BDZ45DRAFT_698874 [Acephala macrosclerotiorum]
MHATRVKREKLPAVITHALAEILENHIDIKMAGSSSSSDINIDTKRSSTAVVREALFRATGEKKWTVADEWAYFLKQRFTVFNNIAKTNPAKNWEDPQVGREIDEAFKMQAKGRIPDWAEPMIEYDKAVEWMRRQHWKNNKNKVPLASSSGESTAGMSRGADGGLAGAAPAPSADEARTGDRAGAGDRAEAGNQASGYWTNVLL